MTMSAKSERQSMIRDDLVDGSCLVRIIPSSSAMTLVIMYDICYYVAARNIVTSARRHFHDGPQQQRQWWPLL